MKITISISCVLVFFIISCEKQPFDYRNKYTGEYVFDSLDFYSQNTPITQTIIDTSYSVFIKVNIVNGKEFNEINIKFEDTSNKLKIDKYFFLSNDGYFKRDDFENSGSIIVNDKSIRYINDLSSLGARRRIIYTGKKIN